MRTTAVVFGILILGATNAVWGQDSAHWGIQGDYFRGDVPEGIVEQIHDLPEVPTISAKAYAAGLVRFHANGSPSWSLEYSRTQADLTGGKVIAGIRHEVRGNGNVRGAMITKFLNFFSTRYFSAGVAFGGGVAKTEVNYYRYQVPPGSSVIFDQTNEDLVTPIFQIVAQADIRPVRWISLSPFYGMRNGALGVGGAVRIHFTK